MDEFAEWDDLTHIRRRPGMYIGGTDARGVLGTVFESIDNAIDQFLAHKATQVVVKVSGNNIVVCDDGPGYPFDLHDDRGMSLGTSYLTTLHSTNTADDHSPHIHCFSIGCGLFCLNALSEKLTISAWRSGSLWRQEFSRGVPLTEAAIVQTGTGRGTTVDFVLDSQIFPNPRPDSKQLREELRRMAFMFPRLIVHHQDESFVFTNGLADLVRDRIDHPAVLDSRISVSEAWKSRPVFYINKDCGDFQIQAAAYSDTSPETEWLCFANGARSFEEGTHREAFQHALVRRVGWRPAIAAVSVIMTSPQFVGPTRSKLDVPQMKTAFVDAISPDLKNYCTVHQLGRYS